MYIYPMAAMVFYIFIIGTLTFRIRSKAVKANQLKLQYFKTHDLKNFEVPEIVVRYGRHFDNQFQMPILFLITLVVASVFVPNQLSIFSLAWVFIVLRAAHSYIHLGSNHVLRRAQAYLASSLVIPILWILILIKIQSV